MHCFLSSNVILARRLSPLRFALLRTFPLVFLILTSPMVAAEPAAGAALAPSPDRVGASFQVYWPDRERGTDRVSLGYDAFYEKNTRSWPGFWRVRAFHEVLETTERVVSDFYRRGAGLDVGRRWPLRGGADVGVFAGAGWVNNDVVPDREDGDDWFAAAGVHLTSAKLGATRLRLRGNLRANYDDYGSGLLDWLASVSVVLPIR